MIKQDVAPCLLWYIGINNHTYTTMVIGDEESNLVKIEVIGISVTSIKTTIITVTVTSITR